MTVDYQSSLARHISDFITFKRVLGYNYTGEANRLQQFDRFLIDRKYTEELLQTGIMQEYCATNSRKSINRRAKLHSILRLFSLHLHVIDPQSAVLQESLVPRQTKTTRFYPLSPLQINQIMTAAEAVLPADKLKSHCTSFMVGLLYSTGLRITEALTLNLKDVNENNKTLFVHRGKFNKDRIIPMSESTFNAVKKWLQFRSHYSEDLSTSPLLISKGNKRLTYRQAYSAFRKACADCGIVNKPLPRLHDLRHNYACRCIALWRDAEEDVNTLMPVLSNAMGHVDFPSTQVYLHVDAAALRQASVKFNQHIKHALEEKS